MTTALIIIGYLASCVGAYLLVKNHWSRDDLIWTRGSRLAVCMLAATGPFAVLAGIIIWIGHALDDDTPASW